MTIRKSKYNEAIEEDAFDTRDSHYDRGNPGYGIPGSGELFKLCES